MKSTQRAAVVTGVLIAMAFLVRALAECHSKEAVVTVEVTSNCDDLGTNEVRMCNKRLFNPSYTTCYEVTATTSEDCVTKTQDCPWQEYINGSCNSDGSCSGGDATGNWGTNSNTTVKDRASYNCGG